MAIDAYSPCPGGSDKKIKFCGCKEIVHDLDRITRMLEGEQRKAALDDVDKLLQKNPDRACLLAIKGSVQMQLGEIEAAKSTVGSFVVHHQKNPVALAQSALLEASERNYDKAVVALQRALEFVDKTIPTVVYEAIGVVGQALLASGNVLGARSHLLLQAMLGGEQDTRATRLLMRLHMAQEIPLMFKQDFQFGDCPTDVDWREAFETAMSFANHGAWLAAVEKLEVLSKQHPNEAAIFRNVAILRSWLGDKEAIILAWRRYGSLDNVPLDDAVEAEALAQLLDPDSVKDKVDVLNIPYPVNDPEKLAELLASDRRVSRMPIDPSELAADGDEPPPKAAFWLLDRPMPTSGDGIKRDDVPIVLAEMYQFGKQTDREARIELVIEKSNGFDEKQSALKGLLGDLVGQPEGEEVTDQVDALSSALTWNWRFPPDTPPATRTQLISEQQREVLLNKWPEQALSVLSGRRPNEVTGDQAYRVRLLAAILLLELGVNAQDLPKVDLNELRRKLELPTSDEVDPADVDVSRVPLIRLTRLAAEKLSDEDLVDCYSRAGRLGAVQALGRLAREVVARESLDEEVDKTEAYEILSRLTEDDQQAIEHIQTARELAVKNGQSPAPFLLTELSLRLERGIEEECHELLTLIQSRHIREPGIGQSLYEMLARFGLIRPDGAPAGAPSEAEPSLVTTGDESPEAGKIWTPDGASEQAAGEEGKSKLWVPGMD